MTAPRAFPRSVRLETARTQGRARGTQMSLTKVLEPRGFRLFFAHRWSQFLHENYRNPEEVAVCYGVRYQTALNWWQGINRPSGDVVALACMRHGKAFTDHMGE